jgi:hypothetical protein
MRYLVPYLAVGAITLALTLLQSHLEKKKRGPSFSETMEELRLQKASTWQRIAHKIIVPVLAGVAIICVWPVAIVFLVQSVIEHRRLAKLEEDKKFRIREQDLIEQLSIDEIEKRERVDDPLEGAPNEPFGHLWPVWQTFVNELSADASLWSFAATDDTSHTAVRLEGYVHFDDGRAQSVFVTAKVPLSEED